MRCPVHRRFFLIRRSSIDGSTVRSSISLYVTLSIQVILMIERKCLAPYMKVTARLHGISCL
ncbi:hypothetical protein NP493_72g03012 [Ridgeia piscesae]|uniref:Uncharacterized protein n=1 Tax=Ridgeia piscesae TaxID=27915 RepID=A0AAD9UIJ2_RIDPI|nr:hypothetical protein NP493_72g03012 [Ridgeia piscesae]